MQPIQEDIMDKEENSSNGQGKIPPDPKNEIPAKSPVKTKRRKKRTFTTEFKLLIALITAITPIAVAYLGYKTTHPDPTAIPVSTPTATPLPIQVFTDMPLPTGLPSWTSTPTTPTTIPTGTVTLVPRPKLIVRLEVNQTSGRRPLTVKLDARQSYLTDYDGQTYVCRNGACYYTWKVYAGGQQIGKSITDSGGTFDYTFGKQGTYMVTVWVCRGRDGVDCNGSGAQIVVTK
jgi:hypothetical protein